MSSRKSVSGITELGNLVTPAATVASSGGFEFEYSRREFERLRALVLAHTGILLSDEKQQLTYSRFAKRLRALGLTNFKEYANLIESGDEDELDHFVSAITTNFTGFFREPHHFDYLGKIAATLGQGSRRIRIWSAGCSSGEEPYSIAITLLASIPDIARWDIRILATDLDRQMVEKASAGVYDAERISDLPADVRRRWFQKGGGSNKGKARVIPEVRDLISFRQLNLMHDWPFKGPFDVIFCRNVIIYFGKDFQRSLFAKFADKQRPGGKLFIGHSENLMGVTDRYRLIGKTIYEHV